MSKRLDWRQDTLKPTDQVKAGEAVTTLALGLEIDQDQSLVLNTSGAITYEHTRTCTVEELHGYFHPDLQELADVLKEWGCCFIYLVTLRGNRSPRKTFRSIVNVFNKNQRANKNVILKRSRGFCSDCATTLTDHSHACMGEQQ